MNWDRALKLISTTLVVGGALLLPQNTYAQRSIDPDPDAALWREAMDLRRRLREDTVDRRTVFRSAALEIAIGMPERALAALEQHGGPDSLWDGVGYRLRGEAEFAVGQYEDAARSFKQAAARSALRNKFVLLARAGVSYDSAGQIEAALANYESAADGLRGLDRWIAVRQAVLIADTASAFQMLAKAAPELTDLVARRRGDLYARAGDTTRAIATFETGGYPLAGAELALVYRDSTTARRLAYDAVAKRDTSIARRATSMVEENFSPESPAEFLALAAATRRLGDTRKAARLAAGAVAAGDSSAKTLLYWGDLLFAARSRRSALSAYTRAAALEGDAAREAVFWQGRTLLLLGRVDEGMAQLTTFAARFPDHQLVPRAIYGMADRRRRERRYDDADSLNQIVAKQWPRNRYASSARMDLATVAINHGDTTSAFKWYRQEIEVRGTQRNVAQFRLAKLRAESGDSIAARAIWAALARADSIGYYGTIARIAAAMPPLNIEPTVDRPRSAEAQSILATIDLLNEAYLHEELELLLDSIKDRRSRSPNVLLDLAEGLIERNLVLDGISLGWLASRSFTLNHPRVLRVVFPWPYRELIQEKARELSLDPYLLAGLIRQESAFTPGAVSRAGAHGLMQLMPPTAREVARRTGIEWDTGLLTIADANLHLGATHLAGLLRHYNNRVVPTLAAYNAGGTPVRRWMRAAGGDDPEQFIQRVTYVETRGYLRTVLRNHALYKALYPDRGELPAGSP